MLVGFTRYSRDQSFSVLGKNWVFLLVMATGSIVGAFIGGHLFGLVANRVLLPVLAALLMISAGVAARPLIPGGLKHVIRVESVCPHTSG